MHTQKKKIELRLSLLRLATGGIDLSQPAVRENIISAFADTPLEPGTNGIQSQSLDPTTTALRDKLVLLFPADLEKQVGARLPLFAKERRRAMARALQHDALALEVLNILKGAVHDDAFEALLLKGAALNGTIYGDAPRVSDDIDLLVREKDYAAITAVLDKRLSRYQGEPLSSPPLHKAQQNSVQSAAPDLVKKRPQNPASDFEAVYFMGPDRPGVIEIHRSLTYGGVYSLSTDALWRRSNPHPTLPARMLSPEDTLINFALHAARENRQLFHGLVDTHFLIIRSEINWALLEKTAAEIHAKSAVWLLLNAATGFLNTPVPDEILRNLRPRLWRRRLAQVTYALAAGEHNHAPTKRSRLAQVRALFSHSDSLVSSLGFLGRFVRHGIGL